MVVEVQAVGKMPLKKRRVCKMGLSTDHETCNVICIYSNANILHYVRRPFKLYMSALLLSCFQPIPWVYPSVSSTMTVLTAAFLFDVYIKCTLLN